MSVENTISQFIGVFNDYAWYIAFIFLVGCGLYFGIRLRGAQVVDMKESSKIAFSVKKEGKNSHVTSFEAFCVGLGARIGVGNIAGVAVAIVSGGPGAVFWMWVFAIIGAGTSFMECTLGQIFKEKKDDGMFHGGPAYYIKNGLHMKKYAMLLALMVIALYGIGFIGVQASNATDAILGAVGSKDVQIVVAVLVALFSAIIIFGGIKRVAKASTAIVPWMALGWLALALITIVINFNNLGNAFVMIFQGAFGVHQFVAGGLGMAIMFGLKRGVFSNEAGIGSIPNVASSADVPHPVKQGLIQSLGTIIDTLTICTASAFVVLTFGSFADIQAIGLSGAPLVQNILSHGFLGGFAPVLLAIFMVLFAYTSLIGYYSMCEANVRMLTGRKSAIPLLRLMIITVVFISSMIPLTMMWDLCDALMAVMAALNIFAVLLLSKYAIEAYRDYKAQKKAGIEDPVFDPKVLSGDTSGITCWGNDKN